jgi:beta-mannosidase
VPGAVQLDWAHSNGWPPYWQGENFRDYRWMEDVYWTYETRLEAPALAGGERLFFICGGVDYRFVIKLNNKVLHSQEGMFTPVEIELTGKISGGDVLKVTVFPAPKSQEAAKPVEQAERPCKEKTWFAWDAALSEDNHTQANASCKPAVSYGWDFHPRLIPLGIWKETFLEVRPPVFLNSARIDYLLSPDLKSVEISLAAHIECPQEETFRWTLTDPDGEVVAEETFRSPKHRLTIENPVLWWPHDHGRPALYTSCIELLDREGKVLDSHCSRVGFRRDWPMPVPNINQRSRPPMTFEINGRSLFAKGANFVSPEIFPGLLNRETYAAQIECARAANMNLLRVWGGAPVPKDSFYETCDELGIMVWQDFPLSCNCYPDDPSYLAVLDRESRSIIVALREHPSLVCWCGGNELFNSWSRMTDQALPLRLLQSNCFQLDPLRPFLPTTPLEGVGHGHYVFRDPDNGRESWSLFQQASYTAYCEFGCPGPAVIDVLREIIPPDELFPPHAAGSWKAHHAFESWRKTSWLNPDVIEHYFGPSESLEELVERGQLLQSEGFKGLFEEVRRQKPVASIALCWCLNEPWPTAANNSLISWPTRPKPSLAAVAAACRPVLASARIQKFQWEKGEIFDPELFWLNDSQQARDPGPMEVRIETADGRDWPLIVWNGEELTANTNLAGPKLHWKLPNLGADRFTLILDTPALPEAASSYVLLFHQ